MTKVTIPEPIYEVGDYPSNGEVMCDCYSLEQLEAYADARVAESQRWHPIDSAPHETLVVLGWYDENEVFKQEIALASAGRRYPGGASDMWWHGRATHWMPLPDPPLPEPKVGLWRSVV